MKSEKTLNAPYPVSWSPGEALRISLFFGLFVFCFLLIFQPFGLSEGFPENFPHLIVYGLITWGVVFLLEMLFPKIFPKFCKEENWTVKKQIFFVLLNILAISAFNLLYTVRLGFIALDLQGFFWSVFVTLSLGIIPVTIVVLLNYFYQLRINLTEAAKYREFKPSSKSQDPGTIQIRDANGDPQIDMAADKLIRIESAQNYVVVHWQEENGKNKDLIRNSLSQIEPQLKGSHHFFRTHRSHLVNMKRIVKVTGNAQGLNLKLSGSDEPVPVSRKNIPDFRNRMQQL
jgi:hypothetical protein